MIVYPCDFEPCVNICTANSTDRAYERVKSRRPELVVRALVYGVSTEYIVPHSAGLSMGLSNM